MAHDDQRVGALAAGAQVDAAHPPLPPRAEPAVHVGAALARREAVEEAADAHLLGAGRSELVALQVAKLLLAHARLDVRVDEVGLDGGAQAASRLPHVARPTQRQRMAARRQERTGEVGERLCGAVRRWPTRWRCWSEGRWGWPAGTQRRHVGTHLQRPLERRDHQVRAVGAQHLLQAVTDGLRLLDAVGSELDEVVGLRAVQCVVGVALRLSVPHEDDPLRQVSSTGLHEGQRRVAGPAARQQQPRQHGTSSKGSRHSEMHGLDHELRVRGTA